MPRRNFVDGMEIVIDDFNAQTAAIERGIYDRFLYEMIERAENVFFGDSFTVTYSSANSINIKKGSGFHTDNTQTSPQPTKRPLYLAADVNEVIETPDSVNDRIDIVCVKNALVDELSGSRQVKSAISSTITTESLTVQKDWEAEILIVEGTPGVSPVAPSTPAGYLRIASLEVTAVSGLAGSGAITDERELAPLGALATVDTTGLLRVTAGASVTIDQLISDIDAFLVAGRQEYTDIVHQGVAPASPSAGRSRLYSDGTTLYLKSSAGVNTPVGSGSGGGGGGANWQGVSGLAPVSSFEYDEKVWLYEAGAAQALTLWVKVPTSYIAGRQITFKGAFYSPASSNNFKMQAATTLIRKNNDAITSTTNVNTSNSGDMLNAVANRMREVSIDLSSASGTINSVAVSAGDIIKVVLSRVAATGAEDIEDVRFIPSSTEVGF